MDLVDKLLILFVFLVIFFDIGFLNVGNFNNLEFLGVFDLDNRLLIWFVFLVIFFGNGFLNVGNVKLWEFDLFVIDLYICSGKGCFLFIFCFSWFWLIVFINFWKELIFGFGFFVVKFVWGGIIFWCLFLIKLLLIVVN